MINEANAHRTTSPAPMMSSPSFLLRRMSVRPGSVQESIIEVQPLKTIVNHATGAVMVCLWPCGRLRSRRPSSKSDSVR